MARGIQLSQKGKTLDHISPNPGLISANLSIFVALLTLQIVSGAGWVGTHLLDVCDVHQLDHLVPL